MRSIFAKATEFVALSSNARPLLAFMSLLLFFYFCERFLFVITILSIIHEFAILSILVHQYHFLFWLISSNNTAELKRYAIAIYDDYVVLFSAFAVSQKSTIAATNSRPEIPYKTGAV